MSAAAATRSFSKSIVGIRSSMSNAVVLNAEQRRMRKKDLGLRIKVYSAVEMVLGFLFFVWSVVHVIMGNLDIGVIAWPSAVLAGVMGLIAVYYYEKHMEDRAAFMGKVHCILIILAHVLLIVAFSAGIIHHHLNSISCVTKECSPQMLFCNDALFQPLSLIQSTGTVVCTLLSSKFIWKLICLQSLNSYGSVIFFVFMAMVYTMSGLVFGRWAFEWYHLFINQKEYGLLADHTGAIEQL